MRNPKIFSLVSRREREILQTNLMIPEEIKTNRNFKLFVTVKRNSPTTIPISRVTSAESASLEIWEFGEDFATLASEDGKLFEAHGVILATKSPAFESTTVK